MQVVWQIANYLSTDKQLGGPASSGAPDRAAALRDLLCRDVSCAPRTDSITAAGQFLFVHDRGLLPFAPGRGELRTANLHLLDLVQVHGVADVGQWPFRCRGIGTGADRLGEVVPAVQVISAATACAAPSGSSAKPFPDRPAPAAAWSDDPGDVRDGLIPVTDPSQAEDRGEAAGGRGGDFEPKPGQHPRRPASHGFGSNSDCAGRCGRRKWPTVSEGYAIAGESCQGW